MLTTWANKQTNSSQDYKPAVCGSGLLTAAAGFFRGTGNQAESKGDLAAPPATPLANLATEGCTLAATVFPRAAIFFPAAPRLTLGGDPVVSSLDDGGSCGDPGSGDRDLARAGLAANLDRFPPLLPPA